VPGSVQRGVLGHFHCQVAIWGIFMGHNYLHSSLAEAQSLTQFLAHEGIRIVRFLEESLQFVQLVQREVGPRSPLLGVHHRGVQMVAVLPDSTWFRRDGLFGQYRLIGRQFRRATVIRGLACVSGSHNRNFRI